MRPEELQAMGVSPEMASLPLEELIKLNERRAARVRVGNLDAGMGEHLPSPQSVVPSYVTARAGIVVSCDPTQVE